MKKSKKIIVNTLLCILLMFQLTACGTSGKPSDGLSNTSNTSIVSEQSGIEETTQAQLKETQEELFEFEETENGLAVTLYTDSEANIYNIPSEHEGKKVVEIAYPGFGGLTHLIEVNIPDTIEIICENAFSNNENMTKVNIGNSVREIGDHSFFRCKSITDVTIPDSVESIGEATFGYCENLKTVTIGANLKTIPVTAFAETGIEEIIIPSSVVELKTACFAGCKNLKKIVIPSSVTKIDKTAFQADTSSSASLPDLVIYGESGSYAETFAKENSIQFVVE